MVSTVRAWFVLVVFYHRSNVYPALQVMVLVNKQRDRSMLCVLSHVNNAIELYWSLIVERYSMASTLKEPGYFDPSHSRRGGADSTPLKISETDRWNIKCVVLVDSYDPPESIGTKKIQNIPCMTSQWRHKWRHVKNTKIIKNRQKHGFSLFFQAKVAFF